VPVDLAAFIVSRVARGLTYAHQKRDREGNHLNIVHRDIGPKNVLMGYEGDVKLTDFGIAKALNLMYNEEGKVIAGKDEYLSPGAGELRRHRRPRRPLPARDRADRDPPGQEHLPERRPRQSRRNILTMPIPTFSTLRPDIDERLEAIIQKALQRDRDQRYQSAAEMLNDLEVYLYSDGYGPTNEKLGTYLRDLFGVRDPQPPSRFLTSLPRPPDP
jgi:serine/threonine protein kinase